MHDQIELDLWLNQHPDHQQAYQNMSQMWSDLDDTTTGIAELRAAARNYRPAVVISRNSSRKKGLAMAASVLLAVSAAYGYWIGFEQIYRTAKGETQEITLADGSILRINTDSELGVRIGRGARRVDLHHGEALFSVAHDSTRPFVVNAGTGQIQDIGTRFNVYAQPNQVAVNVLEGSVQISSNAGAKTLATLSAGESAAFDAQGNLIAGYQSDVQIATAWLDDTLIFSDLPLPQVTEQLARYHAVNFELADKRLNTIKISGSFQADNLALMLKTLQASFPIRITQLDGQHIRIQSR